MAEKKLEPVVTLTPDMKKKLMEAEGDLERAEAGLKTMEKLGMDIRVLQEKVDWSKTVRKTLLEEFGD